MSINQFVPYGAYMDIINTVGKWKIIDLKSLLELSNFDFKYNNLTEKVKKLEQTGLVKSINLNRNKKHLFLSTKGIQFTSNDRTYEISEESLNHDVLVGIAVRSFLKCDVFYNGRMFHEVEESEICPDAVLSGIKKNINYELAIEVELTQKSRSRVRGKYSKYSQSKSYDYCLFVTNKEGLFRTYKRFLLEMNEDVHRKIILMKTDKLRSRGFEFMEEDCFFKGEEKKFREIFID